MVSLSRALEVYRRSWALRLRHDQKDRRTVADNLRSRLLQIQKETDAAKGQLDRAQAPLPGANICPRCWIERGMQIPLQWAEAGEAGETINSGVYRCTAPTCRLEIAEAD